MSTATTRLAGGLDPAQHERAAGPEGAALAAKLLAWYDAHRRVLPWREQPGPYRTWLSEVMLQQTRVDTVLPRFQRFLERFPTVQDLAAADLDEVLGEWSGLGYYSRARNLHKAAQQVVALGAFPDDVAGLRELPGVGEYVAGAVASIALGLDAAAVDGNVERVLSRVYAHGGSRSGIKALAEAMLPAGRAGDFNQALMDLGSSLCSPRAASCADCPLHSGCRAHKLDRVEAFPVKARKRKAPERRAVAGVLLRRGQVLLARRPAEGLFGGLYELPGALLEPGESDVAGLERAGRERLGLPLQSGERLGEVKHSLTHMRLTLAVYRVEPAQPLLAAEEGGAPDPLLGWYTAATWVEPDQPGELGLSTLARKALGLVGRPDRQGGLF